MKFLKLIIKFVIALIAGLVAVKFLSRKSKFSNIADRQKKKNKNRIDEIDEVIKNDEKINADNDAALDELADKYS